MKNFGGNVLFLDRKDINTDEIIPAKYLNENSRDALAPFLLEDLKLDGFDPGDVRDKGVIVTRDNFGCGSSREHAPWALEANGINAVFAPSFARIFRQNMYNCGLMAAELSQGDIDDIITRFGKTGPVRCSVTWDKDGRGALTVVSGQAEKTYSFNLEGFDRALIESDGWVGYADRKY
ncbi:MAG: 3-isopropylmalate dehydratase small subunit [Spirochaetaceae bacterium]|jgi:3-isopropylmalate/(R)-2-methylmalate dehydratase small subunit|nr:3-isopropylmalate dehydratase small subunit [Spirochaetaceae bacterium]